MKRIILYGMGIALLFVVMSRCTAKKDFLRADGKKIVNNSGEVLLRGFGLGGWVLQEPYMLRLSGIVKTQQEFKDSVAALIGEERTQEFYEAWWTNGIQKRDIDSLAAWGFNSIRLPMHYNIYTLPIEKEPVEGQQTWLEKGFVLTDSLLAWCAANKIYLMLDLHAAPGGQGNDVAISDASAVRLWQSEANKQKMIALWRKLAERYVNEEWIGGYDLINEPNYGFVDSTDRNGLNEPENAPLRQLMVDITKAIREVDNNHLIIIEGNGWGNNYNGIFPLWDDNMAISFHKYWNFNDSASIAHFIRIRDEQNAPLWMSESGENSNVWFTDALSLLEKNDIGWCWWTYKRLGLGCPMEIIPPEGYQKLRDYWSGKGAKPSAGETYEILMQLAENYKVENTVYHKDYIDAMIRQVATNETIPFKQHFVGKNEKSITFATDYDLGRSGYAYHDADSANYRVSDPKSTGGNRGHFYRNDGVDIIACNDDQTNGYCVSYTEAGEWLQYTVEVKDAGNYALNVRMAQGEGRGEIFFTLNGAATGKPVKVNAAGAKRSWQTMGAGTIALEKGKNVLRLCINKNGGDVNFVELKYQP